MLNLHIDLLTPTHILTLALFKQSAYASFGYVTAELIYVEGCMANLYQQTILVVLLALVNSTKTTQLVDVDAYIKNRKHIASGF
jgi:hypothetical protein